MFFWDFFRFFLSFILYFVFFFLYKKILFDELNSNKKYQYKKNKKNK